NGVADDKSTYRSVPELIGYYLHERPLLESVPTYRPGDEAELRPVLERIGELVTKPVDGFGGAGVLIGPAATAAEVAARRAGGRRRGGRPDDPLPGAPRAGRHRPVGPGPGGAGPPAAVDHRPQRDRRPAAGRPAPRADRRLQRLHLQLPAAARGAAAGRA